MSEFSLHPKLQADTVYIGDLTLCRLLLINDKRFPWAILVPRRDSIREAHHLNADDRQLLLEESTALSQAMEQLFIPDKLNVAAIGNMVPQLHVHHIARYKSDAAWPAPVWGFEAAVAYSPAESGKVVQQLSAALQL